MSNNKPLDPFARTNKVKPPHLANMASDLLEAESNLINVDSIALSEITPDPRQPRRAIPSAARENGTTPTAMLEAWRQIAQTALGWGQLDPTPYIMGHESADSIESTNPLVTRLFALYGLASSVLQDGLINPVTIAPAPSGNGYIIETGERRYLAYTLLAKYADKSKYDRIPARIMSEHDPFRQAVENTNRSALTAIEKARQLALLYMAMYPERDFVPYEQCATDHEFYAQAAELNSRRGQGQRLLDAMGVSQRSSITNYNKLLKLSAEEWTEADAKSTSLVDLLQIVSEKEGTKYGQKSSYVQSIEHNQTSTDYPTAPTPPPTGDNSPFGTPPNPLANQTPRTTRNGWAVNDRVHIEKYGNGTITEIVSPSMVNVLMDETGTVLPNVHESQMEPARVEKQPTPTPPPENIPDDFPEDEYYDDLLEDDYPDEPAIMPDALKAEMRVIHTLMHYYKFLPEYDINAEAYHLYTLWILEHGSPNQIAEITVTEFNQRIDALGDFIGAIALEPLNRITPFIQQIQNLHPIWRGE